MPCKICASPFGCSIFRGSEFCGACRDRIIKEEHIKILEKRIKVQEQTIKLLEKQLDEMSAPPDMKFTELKQFQNDYCDDCHTLEKFTGYHCQNQACQKKLCFTVASKEVDKNGFGGRVDYTCIFKGCEKGGNRYMLCDECFKKTTFLNWNLI
jgi:hypothetical protein